MKKWLIFVLFSLVPVTGYSLGLGPITMKSALNQPLQAEIDIHSVQKGDLEGLSVRMASDEDFQRISVDKTRFLSQIQFKVVTRKDGSAYIQLSSSRPVTEPYLDFLIEARWPRGRALKEYTVLVDPPVLTAEAPAAVQQVQTVAAPAPRLAPRSQVRSTPRTQTFKPKPRTTSRPTVPAPVVPPPPAPVAAAEPESGGNLNYGRVRRNETLSEIAQKMRPSDVSLQQMMIALLQSNPEAFIGGNINRLKAGAVLRVEDESVLRQLSQTQAVAEVSRQIREWRTSAVVQQTEVASSSVSDMGESGSSASVSAQDDARLKLVAPGTQTAGAGGSGAGDNQEVAQLRENLLLATEALDANKQESVELKGRLSELEEQLESMQRLINLKDQEMAALQSQLKDSGAEPVVAEKAKETTPEVKQAAAQLEQPEVVDDSFLTSDTLVLGVAVLFIIAVVAWMVRRRQKMQEGFEESILNVGGLDDQFSNDDFSASMGGGSRFSQQAQSVGSMASGFAMSDMTGIQTDTSEVDPISEADVYLAYGRHQQAEDILKQALEKDDNRLDYHTKLLEVYNAAGNAPAFEAHAQVMHNKLGGNEADPNWQKVAALGAALCPASPLFGGSPDMMGAAVPRDTLASAVGGVTAEEEDLLDFDFEGDDLNLDTAMAGSGAQAMDEEDDAGLDFDISSLDFSLDDDSDATPNVASGGMDNHQQAFDNIDSLDMTGAGNNDDDHVLDFDMGDLGAATMAEAETGGDVLNFDDFDLGSGTDNSGPIELVDNDNAEVALGGSGGFGIDEPMELSLDSDALTLEEVEDFDNEADLSGEFDEDIFANVDEIGSKLDLAKAYVDMGDSDGARSILDEVMEEGDDTQKQQAQQLLRQMG